MEKQLFLVYNSETPLYIAAENIQRITAIYDPQKIEKVATKVMVLRDAEARHWLDTDDVHEYIKKQTDKRFRFYPSELGEDQTKNVIQYISRLIGLVVDAECSARGNQSTFEAKDELIKKLKWTLENAVATEEKHYDDEETKAGWLLEAKELL